MSAPAFNPELTVTEAPRHGRRRRPDPVRGAPLNWPEDMAERRSAVRAWRKMAARIVNEERLSFRLLAVLPDQIIWSSGQVRASNSRLADEAGGCSEKTIQRDVEFLRLRGLILVEYGWRRDDSGRFVKTRTMSFAVPSDRFDHLDTRGPLVGDTRGPIIVEDAGVNQSVSAAVDTLDGARPDPGEAVYTSCHQARVELGPASLASLVRTGPISGPSDVSGSRLREDSDPSETDPSHRIEEESINVR